MLVVSSGLNDRAGLGLETWSAQLFRGELQMALSRGARRLQSFFQQKQNTAGESWWGLDRIAAELGYHERTIRRWANDLRESGELTWKRRGSTSNIFRLIGQNVRTDRTKCPIASIFTELKPREEAKQAEMPPYEVPNEFGRMAINPEYQRIRAVLEAAEDRISRARSPDAYARAIIERERKPMGRRTA